MQQTTNVIIVGGGFAGTAAARTLVRRLPPDTRLTLVSEESYTTFNPMLPEAVGASIFPEQVVAPLRELLPPGMDCDFVMGRVSAVDIASRTLACETLAGPRQLHWDQLVLAVGVRARLDLIPGMVEHALPLKTAGDALEIRNVVLRRLARMELEPDPAVRAALGRFVVIGGGFSGTEVAGELVDCLASIGRYYPRAERCALGVTLLHDGDHLLPELPPRLGAAALASLRRRGVDVRLGSAARGIDAHGVQLADGAVIASRTVVSTIGTRPNPLMAGLGLPLERGRLRVQPDLSVEGVPGLWALGDCAWVPNAHDGRAAPPTAQFAVREGAWLAHNLLAALRGAPTRPFAHRSRGAMATIGHQRGVALVAGVPLAGLPAWLLWRAYYLSQMPTLRRKLRIFVEWTWGMFFPTDITHLRFTRSAALDAPDAPEAARQERA